MADKPRGATPPNPQKRDPLAERMERVADLLSRLPDAIAGAVANATSRRPVPAAAGVPDAPHADHGAGLFSAISRVVPGLQRFLDRENRDATRPAADPLDAFASLLRRSQRGGAPPDWTSVLAGVGATIGSHPGGPGGVGFQPGDLAAALQARKDALAAKALAAAQLHAQRVATWGTIVNAHKAGGPGGTGNAAAPGPPTAVSAAVPGQVFRRGWNPGITPTHPPIPTSFTAPGNLGSLGWSWALGPQSSAPPPPWTRGWARAARRARRRFGPHAVITPPRPRRNWAAVARAHARSFGKGFSGGYTGVAAHYQAGRNALLSPRHRWRHRRRSQVASAQFARGAAQAFGQGASTFQRFAGAGRMAAASLSSLAGTAGLAATMLGRTRDAVALPVAAMVALRNFAEERFESNRRYGMYNPAVSFAYARTEAEDMRRNWQTARENEGAIVTLTRSVNAMRDALRPSESLVTGLGTRGGIASSEVVASAGRLLNRAFVDDANRALNAADPNGSGTQEWAQWGMRGVHWAAGGAAGFFGNLFNSVLGNPSAGLADQMAATAKDWLEAEKLGQLASKVGPVPLWHQQLNKIAAIDRPFLPPREVRPPGRRP